MEASFLNFIVIKHLSLFMPDKTSTSFDPLPSLSFTGLLKINNTPPPNLVSEL
ncbi:hypothetical protein HanRHA438_Chr07g0312321 [Helianthus annuus]|nr:hypothetical protein HanRHA438_Chr07g0312321 [Helianthus annuus]